MSKKAVQVFRLEDRVLFEAGAVIQAAEAAAANEAVAENQADQSAENQESADNGGSDAGGNAEDAAAQSEDSNSDDAAANVVLATEDGADDADDAQDDIADFSNTTEPDSAENEIAFAESPLNTGDALPSSADEKVLVVINTTVNDSEAIVNDLGDNYEVLHLNSDSAALDQINAYLDANGNTQYSAIHFVTHGKDGAISLAGDKIDINTLNPADWKALGEHLSEDADILFYSCDLASSDEGKAFADAIANLTGADVAASTDTTGNTGDWDLEYQNGLIEQATLAPQNYAGRLATEITVKIDGTDDLTDLTGAITKLEAGGTIKFEIADTFAMNMDTDGDGTMDSYGINVTATLSIAKNITINGWVDLDSDGAVDANERIVLDGGHTVTTDQETGTVTHSGNRVMKITGSSTTVSLSNLQIQNGYFQNTGVESNDGGAGISNAGILTLDNVIVRDNYAVRTATADKAVYGGGIYNTGKLTVTDSQFIANKLDSSDPDRGQPAFLAQGAGIYNSGTLNVTGTLFQSNAASHHGGGIFNTGTATIRDSEFTGNGGTSSQANGGGINSSGTLYVYDSVFAKNKASGASGGGINITGGTATIDGSFFSGNSAKSYGSAVSLSKGTVYILNSTFVNNSSTSNSVGAVGTISSGSTSSVHLYMVNDTFAGHTTDVFIQPHNGGAVDIQIYNSIFASNIYLKAAPTSGSIRLNNTIYGSLSGTGTGDILLDTCRQVTTDTELGSVNMQLFGTDTPTVNGNNVVIPTMDAAVSGGTLIGQLDGAFYYLSGTNWVKADNTSVTPAFDADAVNYGLGETATVYDTDQLGGVRGASGTYSKGAVDKEAASLTVTTTNDAVDAWDGKTSLREAITYAQSGNAAMNYDSDGDGTMDGYRITFSKDVESSTLTLESTLTINGDLNGIIVIDGAYGTDGRITLTSGAETFQLINLKDTDTTTAENVTFKNLIFRGSTSNYTDVTAAVTLRTDYVNTVLDNVEISGFKITSASATEGLMIYSNNANFTFSNNTLVTENSITTTDNNSYGLLLRFNGTTGDKLSILDSTFSNNDFSAKGTNSTGLLLYTRTDGDVEINRSYFTGNEIATASQDGATLLYMYNNDFTYSIKDSVFEGNKSEGALLYIYQSATVQGNQFISNESRGTGNSGAVYGDAQTTKALQVFDNYFYGNISSSKAGALNVFNADIRNNSFIGNKAANGGAVYIDKGTISTLFNNTFYNNEATSNGGAIYVNARTSSGSQYFMAGLTVTGNTAGNRGGGIYVYDSGTDTTKKSTVAIANSIVIGNTAGAADSKYYNDFSYNAPDQATTKLAVAANSIIGVAAHVGAEGQTTVRNPLVNKNSTLLKTYGVDINYSADGTTATYTYNANNTAAADQDYGAVNNAVEYLTGKIFGDEITLNDDNRTIRTYAVEETLSGELVKLTTTGYNSPGSWSLTVNDTEAGNALTIKNAALTSTTKLTSGTATQTFTMGEDSYVVRGATAALIAPEVPVTEVTLDWSAVAESYTYDGTDQTVTVKVMNGETIVDTVEVTYTLNETAVGALHNAGEYTVTVNVTDLNTILGDEYVLATDGVNLSQTVTVKQAQLTIKADNKTITEGDAVGDLTYTVSGLVDGDDAQITGALATESDGATAGTYDITQGTLAIGNTNYYILNYTAGTLTVEAAAAPVETLIVTTGDDVTDAEDGMLSLREAITLVNDNGGEYTIVFADSVTSINLTQGDITISNDVTINGGNNYCKGRNAYGVELIVRRHPDEAGDPATEDMDNVKIVIANGKTLTVEGNLFISRYAGHGNDPELQGIAKKPTVDLSGGNVTINSGAGLHVFDNISIDTLANNGNLYLYGGTENGQTNSFTAYDADPADDKAGSLGNVTYVHLNHSGYDGGWSSDTIELKMSAPNIIAGTYDTLTVRSAELLRDANWIRQVAYYGTSFSNSVDTSDTKGTVTALFEGTLTIDGAVTANKVVIDAGTTLDANAALTATDVENNGTLKVADTFTTNSTAFGNVIYDGTGTQNVAAGTYGDLTLTGGTKTLAGAVTSTGNFASSDTAVSGGTLTLNDAGTADAASSTISNTAFSDISVTNTATGSEGILYVDKDSGNTISNTTGIKMVPDVIYSLVVNDADTTKDYVINFSDSKVTLTEALYIISNHSTLGITDLTTIEGYTDGVFNITFDSSVFTGEMSTVYLADTHENGTWNSQIVVMNGDVDGDGDADITVNTNNKVIVTSNKNTTVKNLIFTGSTDKNIFNAYGGNITFEDVTFTGNSGGGFLLYGGTASKTFINCTITDNSNTWLFQNNGTGDWNFINTTISTGDKGIYKPLSGTNSLNVNFINSIVLSDSSAALSDNATNSSFKFNFYKSVTNITTDKVSTANKELVTYTDSVVDAALTAADIFGSNTLDSEGVLAIDGTGKAANGGTLVGKLDGAYYYLDGANWVKVGDAATTIAFDSAVANYGLGDGATVYTTGQNGGDRTIAMSYGKTYGINGVYNAGAYAINSVEERSFVVDNTADNINPFDGKTTLREAFIYAMEKTGNTVKFSTEVDWSDDHVITLDADLGTLHWVREKNATINGALKYNGTDQGRITIRVEHTLKDALLAYAEANGKTLDDLTAEDVAKVATDPNTVLTEHSIFDSTYLCTVKLNNLILEGGGSTEQDGGIINIGHQSHAHTFTNVLFEGSVAKYGGAVSLDGNYYIGASFTDTVFRFNYATIGGALYAACTTAGKPSVTFSNAVFDRNAASTGGALALSSGNPTATLTNVTFIGNHATSGGAIYQDGGSSSGKLLVINGTFLNNTASYLGGAIRLDAEQDHAPKNVFINSTFYNNTENENGNANDISTAGGNISLLNSYYAAVSDTTLVDVASSMKITDAAAQFAANGDSLYHTYTKNNVTHTYLKPAHNTADGYQVTYDSTTTTVTAGESSAVISLTATALNTDLLGANRKLAEGVYSFGAVNGTYTPPVEVTLDWSAVAESYTYNGKNQTVVVTAKDAKGNAVEIVVKYDGAAAMFNADTYTVTVELVDSENYAFATGTETSRDITVGQATLTVTVKDQTITAGGAINAGDYTVGIARGSDVVTVSGELNLKAGTDTSVAGEYTGVILGNNLTVDNANYILSVTPGDLTVEAKATDPNLTVTTLDDTTVADDGLVSLREAIAYAKANGGGTVTFASSLSGGTITLGSSLTIDFTDSITIDGDINNNGTADITLSGDARRILNISIDGADVTLEGLTFSGGKATNGGALAVTKANVTLNISNSVFTGNTSTEAKTTSGGGAIYISGADMELNISNSTFSGNTATKHGGVIQNTGADMVLNISDSTFSGNTATANGGVIQNTGADMVLNISDSTFSGNTATANGGVINITGSGASVVIRESVFENNTSNAEGGVFYVKNKLFRYLLIDGSEFTGNKATGSAGVIYLSCVNQDSAAYNDFTIQNSLFDGNISENSGGAVFVTSSESNTNTDSNRLSVTFLNDTFINNEAKYAGGAILFHGSNAGSLLGHSYLINCTIIGNHTTENVKYTQTSSTSYDKLFGGGGIALGNANSGGNNQFKIHSYNNIILENTSGTGENEVASDIALTGKNVGSAAIYSYGDIYGKTTIYNRDGELAVDNVKFIQTGSFSTVIDGETTRTITASDLFDISTIYDSTTGKYKVNDTANNLMLLKDLSTSALIAKVNTYNGKTLVSADTALNDAVNKNGFQVGKYENGGYWVYAVRSTANGDWYVNGSAVSKEIVPILYDGAMTWRLPYYSAGAAQFNGTLMWQEDANGNITESWSTITAVNAELSSADASGVYHFASIPFEDLDVTITSDANITLNGEYFHEDLYTALDGNIIYNGTGTLTFGDLVWTGSAQINSGSLFVNNVLLTGTADITIASGANMLMVNTTVYQMSGNIGGTGNLAIVNSTLYDNSGKIGTTGTSQALNSILLDTTFSGTAKYSLLSGDTAEVFGNALAWQQFTLLTAEGAAKAHQQGVRTAYNGNTLYYTKNGSDWFDFNDTAATLPDTATVITQDALGNERVLFTSGNGSASMGAFSSLMEEKTLVVTTSQDIVDEYDGYISLREAIHYATDYGITAADGTATITFDLAAIKAKTGDDDYDMRELADGSVRIDLNQTEAAYTSSAIAVVAGQNYTIDGAVDLNGDGTVEAGERIILDISTAKLADKNIRVFQVSGGTLTLNNVVLYGTASAEDGSMNLVSGTGNALAGAIFYMDSGTAKLTNVDFERSYVSSAGALRVNGGTIEIKGGVFTNISGDKGNGTVIHRQNGGTLTVDGTEFYGNTAYNSAGNVTSNFFWLQNGNGTENTFRNISIHDNKFEVMVSGSHGGGGSFFDSVIYNNTSAATMFNWSNTNTGKTVLDGVTITNNNVTGNIFYNHNEGGATVILKDNTITGNYGNISNIIAINNAKGTAVPEIINNTIAGNTSTNAAFSSLYVANNRTAVVLNNIFADTIGADGFDIKTGGEAAKLNAYHNVIGSDKPNGSTHLLDKSNVTGTYAEIFGNANAKLDVANGVKTLAINPESVAAYGGTLVGKIGNVFYYVSGGNWINAADGTTVFDAFDSTDTTAYGLTKGTVYTTGSNGGDRLIATDYGVYNMGAHALTELLDNNLSAADKLIVNVQGDRFNPFDGKITFREAMDFVQKDTTLESYTVTFAENMQDAEIKLGIASSGTVAFALDGKTVTIDGTDRNIVLQIGGNGAATQIFSLTGGTKLTVNDITFRGSSVYTPADGETAATLSGSNQNKAIADMNNAQLTINGGVFENFKSGTTNTNALIYSNNNDNNVLNISDVTFLHNNASFVGSHGNNNKINITDVLITENVGGLVFAMQNTSNWNFSNVTVRNNVLTTFAEMKRGSDAVLNNVKIHNNTFNGHVFHFVTGSGQGTSVIKMDNSTIANNTLASGKSVFYLAGTAANNLTLTNSTIANNAGGNGITVTDANNTVTMINNIVVGQINDLNVTAGTVNAKYNVYGINTGAPLDKTNVASNMATEFGGTPDVNADGTLTIVNTAKAAYTGTLTAVNGSDIYYVDNSNNRWYKMGGAATETFGLFVNDSTANYGLTVEGAAVSTTAQNGASRLTAADYITFNAGAYALGTLGTMGTEVTSVEDNRNVFDNVITLREAVLHANATAGEQTVTFASTLTSNTIQLTEDILITDDIVIDGTFGSGRITVNAAATDRVFKINDRAGVPNTAGTSFSNGSEVYTAFDATIRNLNMTGGNIAGAGEVKSAATVIINTGAVIAAYQTNLTLENVGINGGNGGNGVGIFTDDVNNGNVSTTSSLTFNNVTVENITGGRAVLSYAENQVYNNVVFRNNTDGAIENGYCGGAIVINSHFEGNSTSQHGGAIKGVFALIENSTFLNNTCNVNGSAIHASGNTLFNNVSVIGNTSKGDKGGAIFLDNGTYTMINCTIANNISLGTLDDIGDGYGAGAINTEKGNKPTLNLINTTVTGNQGVHVGGIDMKSGKLNLYNSIVAGNTTTGESLGDDIRSELGNSSITIQEVTAYNSVSSYFTDADAEEALDANGNFVWDLSGRAFLGELVSSTTPGGTYVKVAENSLLQNMNSSEVTVYTDAASGRITGIKVGDTQVYGNSGGTESKLAADQAGTDLLDGKVYTTIGSVAVEHKEIVSLTVTTGDDVVSGSDNKTSLREALAAAESGSPYTFGVLSDLGDGITFDAAVTTVNVADDLTIGTDISINGGSGVTINVADGKTLAVAEDKAVTVEGTLALNGTVKNNGTLNVANGAVLTVDAFTNNGSMSVTGNLAKTANGTFASDADSSVTYDNGSETMQTILSGTGVTYADLVIATTAAKATGAIIAANLTVNEGKTLKTGDNVSVSGNTTIAGGATLDADGATSDLGTVSNSGSITVSGNLTTDNAADKTMGDVTYDGADGQQIAAGMYDDLTVDANAEAAGAVTAATVTVNADKSLEAKELAASGDVTANGTLTVTDDLTVGGDLAANADVTVNGNATVTGDLNANANVTVGGNATVSGNMNANANVTVDGNVSVDGATAVASGVTLDLNGAAADLGTISNSGAITVSGDMTSSNAADASMGDVTYDGADGQQIAAGTYDDLTVDSDAEAAGAVSAATVTVNADKSLKAEDLTTTGNVTADGAITVTDDLTVGGDLAANADVKVNGDATVTGDLNANADVTVDGNATVSGNAATAAGTTLTVGGDFAADDFTANGTADIIGNATVSGDLNANADVTVGGNATVTGDVTTAADTVLSVGGDLAADDVTANGAANVTGNATVSGDLNANADVTVGGNATVTGDVTTAADTVLSVDGDLAADDVTANGAVNVTGNANISGNLNANADVTVDGNATVTGDLNANADVTAGGDMTVTGNLNANAAVSTDKTIAVTGDVTVSAAGELDAAGGLQAENLNNSGTVDVDGKITVNGTLDNSGTLKADESADSDLTAGTVNNTGSITVTGDYQADATNNNSSDAAIAVSGNFAGGTLTNTGSMTLSGENNTFSGDNAGKVTYNGTGDQTIQSSTYSELALNGGNKTLGGNVTVTAENGFSAANTTINGAAGATLTVNDKGNAESQNSAIANTTFRDVTVSNSAAGGDGNLYINGNGDASNKVAGEVSGIRLVATITVTADAITYGDTMGSIILTVTNASGEQLYKGTADELGWNWAAGNDAIENATENQAYSVDSGESTYYYNGDVDVVINKRVIQVKAQSYTITAGDALPKFLYSYIGELVGVDAFMGSLICSGDGSAAGTYQILQGSLTLGDNYEIIFSAGTLTVEAAPESGKNAVNATQMPDQYNNIIMAEPDVTYQNRRDLHYLYGDACMIETFNGSVGKHYGYDPGVGLRGKTIVANTREIRLSHIVQKPGEGLMPIISTPDAEGNVRGGEFSDGETTMDFLRGGHTREEYEWDKVDFSDLFESIDFDSISKNELFEDEVDEAIAEMTGVIV